MTYQQRIYSQAIADGMPDVLARLIIAWAEHETAYNSIPFNSPVFRSCNNCFGYKWVGQSTAAGSCRISPEGDYYAMYNSIEDSVHEICLWIYRRQKQGLFPANLKTITSTYQLAVLLQDSGFYTDNLTNYSNGLAYWWKQVQGLSLGTRTAGVGLLLLIGVGFAYKYRKQLSKSNSAAIFT